MLKIRNLTLYFMNNNIKKYLLKDVSFSLSAGESLGIIGKSGDGKSTLAKALLEIYDDNTYKENGKIIIDNRLFSPEYRGKIISIIFQNPNSYLNPLLKIGKQIDEMLTYHLKLSKKEAKMKAIELMRKTNLPNPELLYNYYPYELSGGQQQKVCLCIALACNPKILIIDEGTSYLDCIAKKEILTLVKALQNEFNFSLIMISHDLNEIYSMCDKIAIIKQGRMVEFGTKDEIVLNPLHPYTIEILYDYLRFYKNTDKFTCPYTHDYLENKSNITMTSETHYVNGIYSFKKPETLNKIKEQIYENIRNEQHKYLL